MEESFCRLGIFIRPRLQFLVCFVCFMGIYHPGTFVFFSICQSYNQFTISHHDLFEIWNNNYDFYCKTYLQNFTLFWCLYVSVWWTTQKAVWCYLNRIFLSPFPLLLFLFSYCWLESMGQGLMSQNLCFNWPNMLQSQMLRDVRGLHSFLCDTNRLGQDSRRRLGLHFVCDCGFRHVMTES